MAAPVATALRVRVPLVLLLVQPAAMVALAALAAPAVRVELQVLLLEEF